MVENKIDFLKNVTTDLSEKGLASRWFYYSGLGIDCLLFFRKIFSEDRKVYAFKVSDVEEFCGRTLQYDLLYNELFNTLYQSTTFYISSSHYYSVFSFTLIVPSGDKIVMELSDFGIAVLKDLRSRVSDADASICVSMDGECKVAKRLYLYFCQFTDSGEHEVSVVDIRGMLIRWAGIKLEGRGRVKISDDELVRELEKGIAVLNAGEGIRVEFQQVYSPDNKYRGMKFSVFSVSPADKV